MAQKEVIWSSRALADRTAILQYWIDRNKSKSYSEKLFSQFIQATEIISLYPKIGTPTNFDNVRFKVISNYLLFYEESSTRIEILLVWDARQDPKKLQNIFK